MYDFHLLSSIKNTLSFQQNQIDMNRQSDMMAAFEENIIWGINAGISKAVITLGALSLCSSPCVTILWPSGWYSREYRPSHLWWTGVLGPFQDSVSILCHMCACMYVNVITYVHICISFVYTAENNVSKIIPCCNSLPWYTVANIVIPNQYGRNNLWTELDIYQLVDYCSSATPKFYLLSWEKQ